MSSVLLTCCSKKGWAAKKSSKKGIYRGGKVTSAHKLDGLYMIQMLVERLASGGLGAGRNAWLTTRRILISLCFSFFSLLVGLWLV